MVLITNLTPAPLPALAPALKLAETARAHGWWVRAGYAMAEVPDHHHANGNLARPAHRLESVGVYFRRPDSRGWATWHREDGGPWRFVHARVGITRYGWSTSAKTKVRSILERVKDE